MDSIKVIRSGDVRRSKLYYLRNRKGKSARIAEKIKKKIGLDVSSTNQKETIVSPDVKVEDLKKEEVKKETKKASPKQESNKEKNK